MKLLVKGITLGSKNFPPESYLPKMLGFFFFFFFFKTGSPYVAQAGHPLTSASRVLGLQRIPPCPANVGIFLICRISAFYEAMIFPV
jgi:hypothetical protein